MNVLYIEDSLDIGQLVKELLELNNHTVVWVQDRKDLPESFQGFDVVVSDYNVPGGEFATTKQKCIDTNTPLLLCSGNPLARAEHDTFLDKTELHTKLVNMVESISKKEGA